MGGYQSKVTLNSDGTYSDDRGKRHQTRSSAEQANEEYASQSRREEEERTRNAQGYNWTQQYGGAR